ncbi:ATP-binding cassette domain-containing protein [Rodentibacter caecimuris]|uniref:Peptide ABC transporter ATP-binding protein n=1 Tax=Rodentibacter caecimuris TaxID=1796644 RepID=A0ABX3KXT1_9PAST|nr:peptide ABC transporter ATP-binding protein [Rodentibacter heylii]
MPLLQVEGLSKAFTNKTGLFNKNRFYAVKDISFTLARRQTLAIIGKNGSGKSTLAKMIAGIVQPTSGNIRFAGKLLGFGDYAYRAKHIRMVFQDANSAFNPRLNIGQALDAPLRLTTKLTEEERNQKIFTTLNLVGLSPDYTHLKIKNLSVSQKQRVSIARALILEPEIIIIDDALSSLDPSVHTQLLNLTLDLQTRLGISYIYVGQDLGVIKHMADNILVIEEGKMVEFGTPRKLFTHPATDITQRLVESHFGRLLDERSWRQQDFDLENWHSRQDF